jgi:hypothetical protein
MKELAAAGRQGRTVPAADRSGLVRMIEKRYVKTRLLGVHEVRYVITHRGRQALAAVGGPERRRCAAGKKSPD